jgi:hypothetical protein
MRFDLWQTTRDGAEVHRGTSQAGRPWATLWMPKATNPFSNYQFKDEARREEYISEQVAAYERSQAIKAERKAQRAGAVANAEAVAVGDIFDYSWGYDQTNVEFFQVVAMSGRKATLRRLASSTVPGSEGFMSEARLPVKDAFLQGTWDAETLTKLIQWTDDGRAYLSMPYGWCDKWSGTPSYASWYA